jgi:energy-coupling factor transporter ATP-binding protein EcfA2
MKGSRPPDPSDEGLDKGEGPAFATHGTPGRRSAEKNMLKRLKLHRFRYIKPGTELMFTERFNVLLGRNGTGKTTLLDLISMVLRSDFSALRDEEFDIEYEWVDEDSTVMVRFTNKLKPSPNGTSKRSRAVMPGGMKVRHYQPHVRVEIRSARIEEELQYEVEIDGAAVNWREGGGVLADGGVVDVFESSFFRALGEALTFADLGSDAFGLIRKFAQRGGWAYRFDESLDIFDSIVTGYASRMPRSIGFDMAFVEYGSRWPSALIRYEPRRPSEGQSSTRVELPPRSSLVRFPMLAGLKNMSMSLAVEGSWQDEDDVLWWHFGHAEFLFSETGGTKFNQNALSYGQKRLLAFLYYLDANPHHAIADELVNGMHYDWIRACLDEIGDRQAFLTSQNPILLDYLPLGSAAQVEVAFIQCRAEVVDDKAQKVWSNLAVEDAAELFADYKVGIQPVGEILRARGLW